nr:MFS transporter [Planosporangium thailandense]
MCLSLFIATLDNTVLNVAIPHLVHDLDLTAAQTQWVVDAYSLVFAGLLLTAGSLSDRLGRRKGLLLGLVLFGGASVAAAFTGAATTLIVCRGLMGIGGAFLMPGTLSILVHVFDDTERPKAIGIWGGTSALGVAAGPILGGLLVTHFWWGSVFLVNAPVVALALIGALLLVPESRNPNASRPDVVGAALATTGIVAAVWTVIGAPEHGWTSTRVLTATGIAVAALAAFIGWERHTATPMLNLALLRNRRFAGAGGVGVLLLFALAGTSFGLTQYLQLVLGFSPLAAGLGTLPVAVAIGLTAPIAPQLARRIGGGAVVAAGLLLMAAGLTTLAALTSTDSYAPVLIGGLMVGAGMGTAMAPASAALMGSLPREHAGVGSALNDTLQELGAALGVAVLGTVLSAVYRSHLPAMAPVAARESLAGALSVGDPAVTGPARAAFDVALTRGLLVAAVCALAGAIVGWRALRTRTAASATGAPLTGAPSTAVGAAAGVAELTQTAAG